MANQALKFYNMQVHMIKNNRIYEENVAVKNIWKKDNNIFLDLYFYRKKSLRKSSRLLNLPAVTDCRSFRLWTRKESVLV